MWKTHIYGGWLSGKASIFSTSFRMLNLGFFTIFLHETRLGVTWGQHLLPYWSHPDPLWGLVQLFAAAAAAVAWPFLFKWIFHVYGAHGTCWKTKQNHKSWEIRGILFDVFFLKTWRSFLASACVLYRKCLCHTQHHGGTNADWLVEIPTSRIIIIPKI